MYYAHIQWLKRWMRLCESSAVFFFICCWEAFRCGYKMRFTVGKTALCTLPPSCKPNQYSWYEYDMMCVTQTPQQNNWVITRRLCSHYGISSFFPSEFILIHKIIRQFKSVCFFLLYPWPQCRSMVLEFIGANLTFTPNFPCVGCVTTKKRPNTQPYQ